MLLISMFVGRTAIAEAPTLRLYIGTYSTGIYMLDMDTRSEKLSPPVVAGETKNPSFLAIDAKQRFLYAVGELSAFDGKKSGAVSAFSIASRTGKLILLNQRASGGTGPCHLILDASGKHVLAANYSSGSVAVLPIEEDGRLGEASSVIQHEGSGPNAKRQDGPHAHSINLDPAGRFAFVPDLGIDRVFVYRYDATAGKLAPNDPPAAKLVAGAGPRHFAFHPNGKFAYVINELDSTITAFAYNGARGALRELQTISTLPKGFEGVNYPADIHVHPSGQFVYGSNRGHDSIAIFAVDPETGKLTVIGHEPTQGKMPRNFGIDPSGTWLIAANQGSDSLVVFRIDNQSGRLKSTGVTAKIPSPVCVKFFLN